VLILSFSIPVIAQEKTPLAANDQEHFPRMSGTVVDTSGAVIAGATLQLRSVNGATQETVRSNRNGFFIISGRSPGTYRLLVYHPGFETKGIPSTSKLPSAVRRRVFQSMHAVRPEIVVFALFTVGNDGRTGRFELLDRILDRRLIKRIERGILERSGCGDRLDQFQRSRDASNRLSRYSHGFGWQFRFSCSFNTILIHKAQTVEAVIPNAEKEINHPYGLSDIEQFPGEC
jgi:hypothetical protein